MRTKSLRVENNDETVRKLAMVSKNNEGNIQQVGYLAASRHEHFTHCFQDLHGCQGIYLCRVDFACKGPMEFFYAIMNDGFTFHIFPIIIL